MRDQTLFQNKQALTPYTLPPLYSCLSIRRHETPRDSLLAHTRNYRQVLKDWQSTRNCRWKYRSKTSTAGEEQTAEALT